MTNPVDPPRQTCGCRPMYHERGCALTCPTCRHTGGKHAADCSSGRDATQEWLVCAFCKQPRLPSELNDDMCCIDIDVCDDIEPIVTPPARETTP